MEILKPTELSDIKVLSLDVFDTSIFRLVARPEDLFFDVAQACLRHMALPVPPDRFQRLRVHAETIARQKHTNQEVSLDNIYEELRRHTHWSPALLEKLQFLEIEAELATVRANPAVIKTISLARNRGVQIAFVSDMYLPSGTIRGMLESCGLIRNEDLLLISSEHKKSKHRGDLYGVLIEALQIAPSQILHIGDNFHADVTMALRSGIRARHYAGLQFTEIEKLYPTFSPGLDNLPSLITAASRASRVSMSERQGDQALYETGSTVLGPLLYSFINWVFARALTQNIKRLYFVSRDGQIMLETAKSLQKLCPELRSIECRYLHGSRIAWHLGSLEHLDDRHLNWLLYPQPLINAETLAQRLQIPLKALTTIFTESDNSQLLLIDAWSPHQIQTVRLLLMKMEENLLALPEFIERRKFTNEYLRQEGLLDDATQWGLVELGWVGSMLSSLHACLGGKSHIEAFYLCHSSDDRYLPAEVSIHDFLIHASGPAHYLIRNFRLAEVIEALFAADHATVIGYKQTGATYSPRFKENSKNIWNTRDLDSLRAGAAAFTQALPPAVIERTRKTLASPNKAILMGNMHLAILAHFVRCPEQRLAGPFARCDFSEDPADVNRRPLIRPFTVLEAISPTKRRNNEIWLEGSTAISSPFTISVIKIGLPSALWQWVEMKYQGLKRRLKRKNH